MANKTNKTDKMLIAVLKCLFLITRNRNKAKRLYSDMVNRLSVISERVGYSADLWVSRILSEVKDIRKYTNKTCISLILFLEEYKMKRNAGIKAEYTLGYFNIISLDIGYHQK